MNCCTTVANSIQSFTGFCNRTSDSDLASQEKFDLVSNNQVRDWNGFISHRLCLSAAGAWTTFIFYGNFLLWNSIML